MRYLHAHHICKRSPKFASVRGISVFCIICIHNGASCDACANKSAAVFSRLENASLPVDAEIPAKKETDASQTNQRPRK